MELLSSKISRCYRISILPGVGNLGRFQVCVGRQQRLFRESYGSKLALNPGPFQIKGAGTRLLNCPMIPTFADGPGPMISANLIDTRDGHGHFASRIGCSAANPGQRADSSAHRAAARMARIAARGGLGVSRVALFFRDARHQNPLQTDRHWRFVGGAAAADDYGRLHDFFRPLGQAALPRPAISSLLFCRVSPLGLFLAGPQNLHQHRGGKSERDHQSVFPAIDFAGSGGVVGFGGFRNWTGRDGGVDAFFWDPSAGHSGAAAGLNHIGGAYRARGGSVDLGAERFVSRCPRHHALCGAVLDAGLTGSVPEFAGACALALVIWAESNGRSDRWFSVGADWARAATRGGDGSLRNRRLRGAAGRAILLPANGNEYRRPRLESSDALCFGQLAVAVYL